MRESNGPTGCNVVTDVVDDDGGRGRGGEGCLPGVAGGVGERRGRSVVLGGCGLFGISARGRPPS